MAIKMDILSLILVLVLLILVITIFLYFSNKKSVESELSSHGFLGKKIIVPILIIFLLITSIGISQISNNSNFDNRSLADISKLVTITFIKNDEGYDLTGKYENKTSKLVNFVWEIENFGQNTDNLTELKEYISKVKITNPTLPIKISLTIFDSQNNILGKKFLTIE